MMSIRCSEHGFHRVNGSQTIDQLKRIWQVNIGTVHNNSSLVVSDYCVRSEYICTCSSPPACLCAMPVTYRKINIEILRKEVTLHC